jgi:hypothetical protein
MTSAASEDLTLPSSETRSTTICRRPAAGDPISSVELEDVKADGYYGKPRARFPSLRRDVFSRVRRRSFNCVQHVASRGAPKSIG